MLRLTDMQLATLRSQKFDHFVQETAAYLRDRFGRETAELPEGDLERLVRDAHALGEPKGVTSGYDVRRLAECLVVHGADFTETEETGWARDILDDTRLSGRQKMTAIGNYEIFTLRGAS